MPFSVILVEFILLIMMSIESEDRELHDYHCVRLNGVITCYMAPHLLFFKRRKELDRGERKKETQNMLLALTCRIKKVTKVE